MLPFTFRAASRVLTPCRPAFSRSLGLRSFSSLTSNTICSRLSSSSSLFSHNNKKNNGWSVQPYRFMSSADIPHRVQILYGSQTGTAMTFAHELRKIGKKHNIKGKVRDMNEFNEELLTPDSVLVLVAACFGHGEPTDNAKEFYYWLMSKERDAEKDRFKGLQYTVFGLGQSQHYPERYQAVGKNLDRRLEELGATRVLERGEGDDSGDIEEDFEIWSGKLWDVIETQTLSEKAKESVLGIDVPQPPDANKRADEEDQRTKGDTAVHAKYDIRNPYMSTLKSNNELHSSLSRRSCRHLIFEIDPDKTPYTAGDYVGIFPQNRSSEVLAVCNRLGVSTATPIDKKAHPMIAHIADEDLTIGTALTKYYDIGGPPRRSVIRGLAEFAEGEDKDKLLFLSSRTPLANTEYNAWVVGMQQSMLEVLEAFPSIRINSADAFCELLAPLTPRFYSICSTPAVTPDEVHVAASIVSYKTPLDRMHKGVCTSFLKGLHTNAQVPIFIKESLFRLPEDPSTPVIMIGAGTGVAPFRAFIQERQSTQANTKHPGENVLFFGCNYRDRDFIFRQELEEATANDSLNLFPAFAFHHAWWQFVQHRIIEPKASKLVWDLLNKGAFIYVCGDSKNMAPAVHEALTQVIQTHGGMTYEEAGAHLDGLKAKNHYQLDVF